MSFAALTGLLVQFGPAAFSLAESLISKWNSTEPVTLADLEELRKLGQRSSRDATLEALLRSGVALDSPQAVALLALVK